ncbi:MAG: hypothetical protein AAB738_04060 [Patescibacteria group bacterium]
MNIPEISKNQPANPATENKKRPSLTFAIPIVATFIAVSIFLLPNFYILLIGGAFVDKIGTIGISLSLIYLSILYVFVRIFLYKAKKYLEPKSKYRVIIPIFMTILPPLIFFTTQYLINIIIAIILAVIVVYIVLRAARKEKYPEVEFKKSKNSLTPVVVGFLIVFYLINYLLGKIIFPRPLIVNTLENGTMYELLAIFLVNLIIYELLAYLGIKLLRKVSTKYINPDSTLITITSIIIILAPFLSGFF